MLQQILAAGAAGVGALGVVAVEDMSPQLLAHPAAAAELAVLLTLLTFGTVPQEQQPPLLLLDILLPVCNILLEVLISHGLLLTRQGCIA
jgi:hypothetical protein